MINVSAAIRQMRSAFCRRSRSISENYQVALEIWQGLGSKYRKGLGPVLHLSENPDGERGTVLLGDPEGEHIGIPYRLYDENQAVLRFEQTLRTKFPGH